MVDEMINAADTQGREVTSKVRAVYDEVLRRLDIPEAGQPLARLSASWTEKLGREDDEVCHLARVSDLVVLPTPDPDFDGVASLTVNAVLLEGGRPVLLAPKVLPATIGTRIAIAWNGSAEGARAVSDALPLLQQAKLVTVLHVTEEEGGLISAQELVDYLAWQGVTADIHAVSPKGHGAGETLVAAATDWQADLLVMGAYTHSRLRQLIMGGVTRHVLHHAKMPVLLSH